MRIVDLARDLVRLSGLTLIMILRLCSPVHVGEKIVEELLTAEEGTTATCHERIFVPEEPLLDGNIGVS